MKEMPIHGVEGRKATPADDLVAVEEPLEIRLEYYEEGDRCVRPVSVTMRTPGDDVDLALGFLYTEGVVRGLADVDTIRHSGPSGGLKQNRNVVTVSLKRDVQFDAGRLERHFYTTSSCGVCGKTSLEAVHTLACTSLPAEGPVLDADVVHTLPGILRRAQAVFQHTGGLHAAALFDTGGVLLDLREDVGRHNAVDKLIGTHVLHGSLPLDEHVLLVSGRASFELVQKALMAGIPIMAAVGAPSSLAVELARSYGMTLLGFVRNDRYNIYSGAERVRTDRADIGEAEYRPGSRAARHETQHPPHTDVP